MPEYTDLGADLTMIDLYYLEALLKSLNLDIDTVTRGPYVAMAASLIADKVQLVNDALAKANAAPAIPDRARLDAINRLAQDAAGKLTALQGRTPAAGAITITPYMPGKALTLPPLVTPGSYLYPSADTISKLVIAKPVTKMAAGQVTPLVFVAPGKAPVDITAAAQAAGGRVTPAILAAAGAGPSTQPAGAGALLPWAALAAGAFFLLK